MQHHHRDFTSTVAAERVRAAARRGPAGDPDVLNELVSPAPAARRRAREPDVTGDVLSGILVDLVACDRAPARAAAQPDRLAALLGDIDDDSASQTGWSRVRNRVAGVEHDNVSRTLTAVEARRWDASMCQGTSPRARARPAQAVRIGPRHVR